MRVLILVSYELTGRSPVDRRIEFFQMKYGVDNVQVLSLHAFFSKKRGLKRRGVRLLIKRSKFLNAAQVAAIKSLLDNFIFDKLIITVPDAELLELVTCLNIDLRKLHIDIRDGISFENLYSKFENFFLKGYLDDLERLIAMAAEVTTNIPVLKNYYQNKFTCDVQLALPEYKSKLHVAENPKKLVFIGGLLRSSIGLNAIKFSISIRGLSDVSVLFIGRFYLLEKILYSALSNGRIKFEDEMSAMNLLPRLSHYDCGLVFANCKRSVMPSKISVYCAAELPFVWIGAENDNSKFLQEKIHFKRVDDDIRALKKEFGNDF